MHHEDDDADWSGFKREPVPITVCPHESGADCGYPLCSCALAYMPADLPPEPEPHHNLD